MDKEKFDAAETTLYDLLKSKKAFEEVDLKNRDYYFIKCLDREIIKVARELIAAAGDDIVGTLTPAGIKEYPSGKREFVCTKLSYRDPNATVHTD